MFVNPVLCYSGLSTSTDRSLGLTHHLAGMNSLDSLQQQYADFLQQSLSLNMERGQPSDENFDLSLPLLSAVDETRYITDAGVDIRNYPGGVTGLVEAREIFCEQLGVAPDEIMLGNNSSLEMMSRFLSWALLNGVNHSEGRWLPSDPTAKPKLIVTVPGYDRHFSLAQSLGYELVTVAMTAAGPDTDAISALVADASVKGLFFVPTYSNPTGDTISEAVARTLVSMPTAAPDFTIFADDAYAVHHLEAPDEPIPNLLQIAKSMGTEDRVLLFGSTSKVTFASGGIGLAGMSRSNIAYWSQVLNQQTIGPNKAEQWRHVLFLRAYPGGLSGLMRDHASILKPKFDRVESLLNEGLGNLGLASWTHPKGGYFVSLDTSRPVADRVIELSAAAGLKLTPTGATFPGGIDPGNTNIRLAPTRPSLSEIQQAMTLLICCIKLASAEYDAQAANP